MKKLLLILICCTIQTTSLLAQIAGAFTTFENFGSRLSDNSVFKSWKNETIILPFLINTDSESDFTVKLSFDSKNFKTELLQLHLVEGDISAGNCGEAISNGNFEKKMFPDRAEVLTNNTFKVEGKTNYGLVKIQGLNKLKSGKYPLTLLFTQAGIEHKMKAVIHVIDRNLPDFSSLNYEIDFWQFPLSISTYHALVPYSSEHWNKIALMFDQLKGINQGVVTTSIFYDLYNTSVKPLEQMMIQVCKKKDGSFTYNYSIFEKYVELAVSKGISKEIAVHNLFPWNLTYFYFDEASGQIKTFTSEPGTPEYKAFWKPFLIDFASFLKSKKWMDKTVFWIDERDFSMTENLIHFVKEIEPKFKFGYSGTFSSTLSEEIFDYSLSSNIILEPNQLAARISKGYKTTIYTSCFEVQPNMLIASNYEDIYFLVMLSRAHGYDGMLRWAFNLWSPQIMKSALFSDLPSGDSHFVYPDGQVSLRYLLLKDALEEVLKADQKANLSKTQELITSHTRYFLRNNQTERSSMVRAMKNYLND
ncbi:uncharacterized protein DUF4091 [Algoriphagus ratkowskyi]|uniref:DUF4091 domain-containing protein n=1 Tax=Algoriphagus ratkowskyi TaxID=57028 RepID=A0A2W7T3J2_9BACT|nr:glycoside hydrolase domain-containing protein [Algoriphagus ratkowskyi]PZX57782.1 uncharacterized protein DUF4091 [Algoriphagus ratkowskyi]TXD79046.1 DUF4091 domain-containing protein [Algoriphagus ratkowskyi]